MIPKSCRLFLPFPPRQIVYLNHNHFMQGDSEPRYKLDSIKSKISNKDWKTKYSVFVFILIFLNFFQKIIKKIGRGGFSNIYSVKDNITSELWAAKVTTLEGVPSWVWFYINFVIIFLKAKGRSMSEVEIHASIPFHPCVIEMKEAFIHPEKIILIMYFLF